MLIQHNMAALNANRNLGQTKGRLGKVSEKLSSGYRINRAGDDAAGLTISEKMRYQIRGSKQASRNAADGISLLNVAEGALQEEQDVLHRMRELTVQAANDTNTSVDRRAIAEELGALINEVDRIAETTRFNDRPLIRYDMNDSNLLFEIQLQVGANAHQNIDIEISCMDAQSCVFPSILAAGQPDARPALMLDDLNRFMNAGHEDIAKTIPLYDEAIDRVSEQRSYFGALTNRLEHTIANLDNTAENTQAAESRIRDTDMASQMVEYSKENILQQAGQSILAQANQSTQGILSLLG
jgi:flagellin